MTIARKLGAEIREGRKHTKVVIRVNGSYIGQYGIRRHSTAGHDYIPRQIHVTTKEALGIARCTLDFVDYTMILRNNGYLPAQGG